MTRHNLFSEEPTFSLASFDLDDEFEPGVELPVGTVRRNRHAVSAARQLERRAENRWLREQLTDWDEFDEHSWYGS